MVPIFRGQIERGGPVTVTDPEMTRYFMTIPEAVQLVIRAGDLGGASGEVFVLEMGEPVKIVDLAHNMIRLAGYEPEVDIAIEYVGRAAGREDPRGALQLRRATAADRIRADRPRGSQGAARPGVGERHAGAPRGAGQRRGRGAPGGTDRRAGLVEARRGASGRRPHPRTGRAERALASTPLTSRAAAMSSLVKDVGAVAGIASFLGLALLALLYFTQARDVRRLREHASFLVEGGTADGETVAPAERAATRGGHQGAREGSRGRGRRDRPQRGRGVQEGRARPAGCRTPPALRAAPPAPRRTGVSAPPGSRSRSRWPRSWSARSSWSPGSPSASPGSPGAGPIPRPRRQGQAKKGPCPPGQTKVAVLNGTATPGLAASSAGQLKQAQYKVGPVGNTSTPFPTSVVMFDPTDGKECAPIVGQIVGYPKTQPMNNEVRQAAEGDPVAVVLGDDKAGASSGTGASGTTGSGI